MSLFLFIYHQSCVGQGSETTLKTSCPLPQAREQVLTKDGLEDAPVTLPHHPLKKFAEATMFLMSNPSLILLHPGLSGLALLLVFAPGLHKAL